MEFQSGAVSPTGSIKEGWNIIKDDYWKFFGICLVWFVIVILVAWVITPLNDEINLAVKAALSDLDSTKNTGLYSASIVSEISSQVIINITNFFSLLFSTILMCGIYISLFRKVSSGRLEFVDLFSGFNKFLPCFVISFILSIVYFITGILGLLIKLAAGVNLDATTPFEDGDFDLISIYGLFGIIDVISLLPILVELVIGVATMFFYPMISEKNISGFEAFSVSLRSSFSNFFGVVGLSILQWLMLIGGLLAFGIGIIFVLPILFASTFAAYRSVFGGIAISKMIDEPPPPPTFHDQSGY